MINNLNENRVENKKQESAVEWLESIIFSMIMNGGDSDLIAVLEHCKKAKEIEQKQKYEKINKAINEFNLIKNQRLEQSDNFDNDISIDFVIACLKSIKNEKM